MLTPSPQRRELGRWPRGCRVSSPSPPPYEDCHPSNSQSSQGNAVWICTQACWHIPPPCHGEAWENREMHEHWTKACDELGPHSGSSSVPQKIIKSPLTPSTRLLCSPDELMEVKALQNATDPVQLTQVLLTELTMSQVLGTTPHLVLMTSISTTFTEEGSEGQRGECSSFNHTAHTRGGLLFKPRSASSLPCFGSVCSSSCTTNARPPHTHREARRAAPFLTELKVQMDMSSHWQKPRLSFQVTWERRLTLCYSPEGSANTIRCKFHKGGSFSQNKEGARTRTALWKMAPLPV